ncbi:hypothetical protein ID866_9295 [Astraeus odoratus]|nr:hypothetical protein ID866_9295 [Astraeus odoratus]
MGTGLSKLLYPGDANLTTTDWDMSFLGSFGTAGSPTVQRALVILNQPFSQDLLHTLWATCSWRCCADGGANRLFDLLGEVDPDEKHDIRSLYIPDLIKGDLDSLRADVRDHYVSKGVTVIQDHDQDSTDLMKCIQFIQEKEAKEEQEASVQFLVRARGVHMFSLAQYEIIILGGLTGRLDQTVHTLSYLHKLRKARRKVFVATDDNIAWVLDEVFTIDKTRITAEEIQGKHRILIDHDRMGPTCGLLPVGVESTTLTTSGLRWNLDNAESSFNGLMSTSNHLVPEEQFVTIKTSKPIWWCAELRKRA